jgi:hypothetical protein
MSRWTGGMTNGILILLARKVEGPSLELCPLHLSIYLSAGWAGLGLRVLQLCINWVFHGLWFDMHLHVTASIMFSLFPLCHVISTFMHGWMDGWEYIE